MEDSAVDVEVVEVDEGVEALTPERTPGPVVDSALLLLGTEAVVVVVVDSEVDTVEVTEVVLLAVPVVGGRRCRALLSRLSTSLDRSVRSFLPFPFPSENP